MIHRTLLLTVMFPPSTGGAERYLETLARRLAPEQLTVVAPPSTEAGDDRMFSPAVILRRNLHTSRWLRPAWLAHLLWLTRLIRRQHISRVVFGHYGGYVGLGPLLRWLTGAPFIVSIFGLDLIAYRRTLIRRWLLRWTLQQAEWITTISTDTRRLLREFGVPDGKIVLAPPGIESVPIPDDSRIHAFRKHYHLGDNPLLLTVARLVKRKGHIRILRALPKILQTTPNLLYVIVGQGQYQAILEKTVAELNLGNHVRFLGRLPDDQRDAAYAAATAFIMAPQVSRDDTEGFGIVYTEALRVGTPIIATTTGGVTDIVRHGQNGLALPAEANSEDLAAAVIRLTSDQALRNRLSSNGRNDVLQRFSIERQITPFRILLARANDEEQPLVSVIIPAFNAAESIARTLHGLAIQSYRRIEVLVVDDGSTDQTTTVVAAFPEVKLLRQDHAGAPAARNLGRNSSTGQYLLFCDADVTLHPRMIERMVTTLEAKPDASYAYSNFRFGWRTFDLFDFDRDRLRRSNYISMMSLIRRRDCPPFDETIERLQDWDLWLTMLERGQVGTWIPARLFSASIGKRGISQKIQAPPATAIERILAKHGLT